MKKTDLVHILIRGISGSVMVKLTSAILSFVMFILIARGMTSKDFALFGIGFSAATLMVMAGSMGMRLSAVRFVPVYLERGDMRSLYGLTRYGYRMVTLGCSCVAMLFVVGAHMSDQLNSGIYPWSVGIFALALALAEYQAHLLRGHGRVILALAPREIIWRTGVCLLFSFSASGFLPEIPVTLGFFLMAALLFTLSLGQAFWHPATRPTTLYRQDTSLAELHIWKKSSRVFWGTSVIRAATPNVAMLLVGYQLNVIDSGAFFAALRLAMIVNLVLIAASMLAMPMLSRAHERADRNELYTVTRFVVLFTSAPAIVCFLFFVFVGDRALELYGHEYTDAKGVLLIIATGYLIKVLCGPAQAILQMMDEEVRYLYLSIMINVVMLLFLPPLVWQYGAYGAAVAVGTELAATGIVGAWICRHKLKIDPSIFTFFVKRINA